MSEIAWDRRGIFQDDDMPDIENFRTLAMGVWVSPLIDVSDAFEILEEINSGTIGYFARPIDSTDIEVFSSLDNRESWQRVNNSVIKNADRLNDYPYIQLRVIVKSYISQLIPEKSPQLYSVTITLSDKNYDEWSNEMPVQLEWGDN